MDSDSVVIVRGEARKGSAATTERVNAREGVAKACPRCCAMDGAATRKTPVYSKHERRPTETEKENDVREYNVTSVTSTCQIQSAQCRARTHRWSRANKSGHMQPSLASRRTCI